MNRSSTIYLKVLTPETEMFSDVSTMVVAPAKDGEIGVLPGHMNLATTLEDGVVRIYHPEEESTFKIFISGGIAHFEDDNMQILTEYATNLLEMDQSQIKSKIDELRQNYESAAEDDRVVIGEEIELNTKLLESLEKETNRRDRDAK